MAKEVTGKVPLTVGVLTKNSAELLVEALQSVRFADDIIVIDNGSTDATTTIAAKYTKKIFLTKSDSFSEKRNMVLEKAAHNWIYYLDADEVITPQLRTEIAQIVKQDIPGAYHQPRINYFLGTKMYVDGMERLFHKNVLTAWEGRVHEHPLITGKTSKLTSPLIHRTHRTISSMLTKTNEWSEIEAQLRIEAKHPPMAWWRLYRIMITVLWQQFIHLHVGQFGRAGIFEGYFQIIDKLIVYTKLWERQQR
jgi:hypothetical protein